MKLQILSDLHCEFFNEESQFLAQPLISPEADVIILPGDIHNGMHALTQAQKIAKEAGKPVIFVPGNHEYYHNDMQEMLTSYRKGIEGVHVLLGVEFSDLKEQELYVDIDGVRFCGGTFWTDFNLYKGSARLPTQEMAMIMGSQGINDFRIIRNGSNIFTAKDSLDYFKQCYKLTNQILDKPFDGKKVLVTHHGLHKKSIHAKYSAEERQLNSVRQLPNENTGWMINPAFASHCPEILQKVDVHVHGHTHTSLHYTEGKCRVYTNPRGYPMNRNNQLAFENPDFQPILLVEV